MEDEITRQRLSFSFPELQCSLLEFNSRQNCQHLINWTRWNKVWGGANSLFEWRFSSRHRRCCLSSLKMSRGRRQREHKNSNRLNKQNNNQSELGFDLQNSAPEDFACIWQSKRVVIIAIDFFSWGADVSTGKRRETRRNGCFRWLLTQWASNNLKPSEAWALLHNVLTNYPFKKN